MPLTEDDIVALPSPLTDLPEGITIAMPHGTCAITVTVDDTTVRYEGPTPEDVIKLKRLAQELADDEFTYPADIPNIVGS